MATCYYRSLLSPIGQKAYDTYLNGFRNYKKSVVLPKEAQSIIKNVIYALDHDYPEYFFAKPSSYLIYPDRIEASVRYIMPRDNASTILKMLDALANRLFTHACEAGMKTPLEVAAYFHDYITDNIFYTTGDKTKERNHNMIGALINGSTVCDGYSQLYLYLLDHVGIPALYVSGKTVGGSSGGHAWNMINIGGTGRTKITGGTWYHIDVTWDCKGPGRKGDWDYFMLSDDDIRAKKHILQYKNGAKLPKCPHTMRLNRSARRII